MPSTPRLGPARSGDLPAVHALLAAYKLATNEVDRQFGANFVLAEAENGSRGGGSRVAPQQGLERLFLLTETAAGYWPGRCPASAVAMELVALG